MGDAQIVQPFKLPFTSGNNEAASDLEVILTILAGAEMVSAAIIYEYTD